MTEEKNEPTPELSVEGARVVLALIKAGRAKADPAATRTEYSECVALAFLESTAEVAAEAKRPAGCKHCGSVGTPKHRLAELGKHADRLADILYTQIRLVQGNRRDEGGTLTTVASDLRGLAAALMLLSEGRTVP